MKKATVAAIVFCVALPAVLAARAQAPTSSKPEAKPAAKAAPAPRLTAELLTGLAFRNIGPAIMSGRISDIAIHPRERHTWYVAVGSGGVWKTENAGTTWTPVFDGQGSYSIGCVTIDPPTRKRSGSARARTSAAATSASATASTRASTAARPGRTWG